MKTRVLAAILLVLATGTGCAAQTSSASEAKRIPSTDTILFAQDSVGFGLNATAEDRSFRPLVTAALNLHEPVREITYGKPGYTLDETAALVKVPKGLDYAVIELGSNDANQNGDEAQFSYDYAALLARLTTASPEVKIVCLGTLGTFANTATFDALISSACTAGGGTFISIADITTTAADLASSGSTVWGGRVATDGQHPNDAGHALIAARILAALN